MLLKTYLNRVSNRFFVNTIIINKIFSPFKENQQEILMNYYNLGIQSYLFGIIKIKFQANRIKIENMLYFPYFILHFSFGMFII